MEDRAAHFNPFLSILRRNDPAYLIWDDFTDTRAAGAIDGTPATPGPGTRKVFADTGSNLSIGSGVLNMAAAVAANDPTFYYEFGTVRQNGLIIVCKVNQVAQIGGYSEIGWAHGTGIAEAFIMDVDENFKVNNDDVLGIDSGLTMVAATDYYLAVVAMLSGAYWFIKGGVWTTWKLIWFEAGNTDSPITAFVSADVSRNLNVSFIHASNGFLPVPWLSDGFSNVPTVQDLSTRQIAATPNKVGFGGPIRGTWHAGGYLDLVLSTLNNLFDPQECTVIQRVKLGKWNGGVLGNSFSHVDGVSGKIYLRKSDTDNTFEWYYSDTLNIVQLTKSGLSTTGFIVAALTVSQSNNLVSPYWNGAAEPTQAGVTGIYSAANRILVGAEDTTPTAPFPGWISDTILGLNGVVLSASDIATITTLLDADSLDTETLDLYFGTGNWVWFDHSEQYQPDGAGHTLANGPGIRKYIGNLYTDSGVLKNSIIGGDQVLPNTDFDNWTGDDPDNWTIIGQIAPDPEITERASNQTHADAPAGTGAANFYATAAGASLVLQRFQLTQPNQWHKIQCEITALATGRIRITAGTPNIQPDSLGVHTFFIRNTTNRIEIAKVGVPVDLTVDWFEAEEIELEQFTQLAAFPSEDVLVDCELATVVDGAAIGLVLNVDNPENIQNGVFVYYHPGVRSGPYLGGANDLVIEKMVGGVFTDIAHVAIAHGASKILRVIKDSTAYKIYYDGALVSSQTINDAGIISNKWHGAIVTDGNMENLVVHARHDWEVIDRYTRE